MADLRENIDNYLTNQMNAGEQLAFENEMANNPGLKANVDAQRVIIDQIKKFRAAELKTMLQNVPIAPGVISGATNGMLAKAIIATVAGALVVGGIYFFSGDDIVETPETKVVEQQPEINDPIVEDNIAKDGSTTPETVVDVIPDESSTREPISVTDAPIKDATTAQQSMSAPTVHKPDVSLEITDTEAEVDNATAENAVAGSNNNSPFDIRIERGVQENAYHYQVLNEQLVLYGNFDQRLYEIIEINADETSFFLFLNDQYHWLDENQVEVTEIEPITDDRLINKLNEYRSSQGNR